MPSQGMMPDWAVGSKEVMQPGKFTCVTEMWNHRLYGCSLSDPAMGCQCLIICSRPGHLQGGYSHAPYPDGLSHQETGVPRTYG